jgi:hypothetical protein
MKQKLISLLLIITAILITFAGPKFGINKNLALLAGLICASITTYFAVNLGYANFFAAEIKTQKTLMALLNWILIIGLFLISAMLLSFNLFQLTLGLINPAHQVI